MKILIIRFSAIGDIVLCFHVLHKIQINYPEAEIHFLTKEENIQIFDGLERKPIIHSYNHNLVQLGKLLRKEKFDTVIDLHNNLRTLFLQFLMRRFEWHRFKKLNIQKALYTGCKIDRLPSVHVVDRYLEACKHLNLIKSEKPLIKIALPINVTDLGLSNNGYVAWVLGAKFKTKQVPFEKIIEILERISMPVVLVGGHGELKLSESIQERFPNVKNLVGKLELYQSVSIAEQSKMIVTNDTGLMHFAALFDKPLVCIWGNTSPKFGMYPYESSNVTHFEVDHLKCRPCSKIGSDSCPKMHFDCMIQQDSKRIAETIISKFHA